MPRDPATSPSTIVAWMVYVTDGSMVAEPSVQRERVRDARDIAVDLRDDDRALGRAGGTLDQRDDRERVAGELVRLA